MLLRGQTTQFHMNAILPIVSYTNGVGFPIQFAYWPKATPFAGKVCETNRSLVRTESCWKTRGTVLLHCSQPCISQVSTWFLCASGRCVGVRQAMTLIGNARQAMSKGKSSLVETGPVATALSILTASWYLVRTVYAE